MGKSEDFDSERPGELVTGNDEEGYMEDEKSHNSAAVQYDLFTAPPFEKSTASQDRTGGNRDQTESFERTPVGSGDEDDGFAGQTGAILYHRPAHSDTPYLSGLGSSNMSAPGLEDSTCDPSLFTGRSLTETRPFGRPSTDLSPMIYERSGLKYVVTPSDSGSILGATFCQAPNPPEGISYSQKADAGPSTTGSEHISLPIHELQSGTLGEIGRFYPSYNATYTSPPTDFLASGSPNISSLLNPDPLSRAAILPHFPPLRSPIDAILPRPLLHLIIGLFKDFVYPLTPCIHMPTLIQDLARRREMEPGQEEWTAMVLATVMSTVVQVPRAFVPLSRGEVSALAERCYMETRKWSMSGYSDDSLTVNAGESRTDHLSQDSTL